MFLHSVKQKYGVNEVMMDLSQEVNANMESVIVVDVCWEKLWRMVERWKKVKVRIEEVRERVEVGGPLCE